MDDFHVGTTRNEQVTGSAETSKEDYFFEVYLQTVRCSNLKDLPYDCRPSSKISPTSHIWRLGQTSYAGLTWHKVTLYHAFLQGFQSHATHTYTHTDDPLNFDSTKQNKWYIFSICRDEKYALIIYILQKSSHMKA